MNDLFDAILNFHSESMKPPFIEEQKKVASSINAALSQNYQDDGSEIDLVRGTITALNSTSGRRFKIESVFIHGNRSQVQFDYYGKRAIKEMGDLILVSTMTYNSKRIFQKITIVQAKKDSRWLKSSWAIEQEQLHFLSTWPVFNGVRGIFPKSKNVILDNTGCMGSYVLYRKPGDFVFLAAPTLGRCLGGRKRVNLNELTYLQPPNSQVTGNSFNNQYMDPEEWFYIWRKYIDRHYKIGFPVPLLPNPSGSSVLGNQLIALNVNDAVYHLSRLNIGEPIYSSSGGINVNENAFRLLNTILRYLQRSHSNEIGDMNIFRYMAEDSSETVEEHDMSGTSIGLVHTMSEVAQG